MASSAFPERIIGIGAIAGTLAGGVVTAIALLAASHEIWRFISLGAIAGLLAGGIVTLAAASSDRRIAVMAQVFSNGRDARRLVLRGAGAGIVASSVMALYAIMASGTFLRQGWFTPVYGMAAPIIGPMEMMHSMTSSNGVVFQVGGILSGIITHSLWGGIYGILFSVVVRILRLRGIDTLIGGLVFGFLVLLFMSLVVLPLLGLAAMPGMVGWSSFTFEHLLFGGVLGLWPLLRPTDIVTAPARTARQPLDGEHVVLRAALAGIVASSVMAVYAIFASGALLGQGWFTPLYGMASPLIGPQAMMTSMKMGTYVAGGPALMGLITHTLWGALFGIVFGWLIRSRHITGQNVLVAGAGFGLAVLLFMSFLLLPLVGAGGMPGMVGWPSFIFEHLLFGLVLGLWSLRHPQDFAELAPAAGAAKF
jgi:uncharacterized membrane protein YagU involved in acid resistance